jgi:hypothetical protein
MPVNISAAIAKTMIKTIVLVGISARQVGRARMESLQPHR